MIQVESVRKTQNGCFQNLEKYPNEDTLSYLLLMNLIVQKRVDLIKWKDTSRDRMNELMKQNLTE